ncbi:MAG TPA: hypothetical protein PLF84_11040 [Bryobacteraceae bacterium]|nr:hypothetical protein [Bryobacterales bacterium]HRJ19574.1 hypothetical protein [Bryobacteraceae bacterium]
MAGLLCCAIGTAGIPEVPVVPAEALSMLLRKKRVTICLKDTRCVEGRFRKSEAGVIEVQEKRRFDVTALPLEGVETIRYRGKPSEAAERTAIGLSVVGYTSIFVGVRTLNEVLVSKGTLMVVTGAVVSTVVNVRHLLRPKFITLRIDPGSLGARRAVPPGELSPAGS